eukprot:3175284-Amphidinium_carterae.1
MPHHHTLLIVTLDVSLHCAVKRLAGFVKASSCNLYFNSCLLNWSSTFVGLQCRQCLKEGIGIKQPKLSDKERNIDALTPPKTKPFTPTSRSNDMCGWFSWFDKRLKDASIQPPRSS